MLFILLTMLETEEERKKLSEIYEDHKYALLAAALKVTHNQQMAEDAVHNTFVQLIEKNKGEMFTLPCRDFRRRYVIIVKNKAIDLMRKEGIYTDTPMEELDYEFASGEVPVDIQIVNQEEYALLRSHIASLDEISIQVLEMKYVLDMSYKEIGAELGMTAKHVDTRIMRAKAKVRKLMEGDR